MRKFKFQKVLITAIIVSAFYTGLAKPSDLNGKGSVIFTYEAKNYIVKFRPIDYIYPSKTQRIDFLLGKRFGNESTYIRTYGYWKHDNMGRSWIGTQFDLSQKMLNEKISALIILRYFTGLNKKSMPHFYVIPILYYKTGSKVISKIGISGYGKKIKGQNAFFFLGVDTFLKLNHHIDVLLSISKNTLGSEELIRMSMYYGF